MKNVFAFFLTTIAAVLVANAQTRDGERLRFDAIKIGCKFKLQLEPTDSLIYTYKIASLDTLPPESGFNFLDVDGLFPKKIAENTIEGYFCTETSSMDSTKRSTMLILKSGMDCILRYDAAILVPGGKSFEPTSVVALYPQLPVSEFWPYPIEAIALLWFRKADNGTEPKEEIKNTLNQ